MAIQYATRVRNAKLDAVETEIGTSPYIEIRTGLPPANTIIPDTGTLLVQIPLPSDWMAAASGGTKAKSGTWSGTAVGTGTAGYFRMKSGASPDDVVMQGRIETTGGSPTGDMGLDNTSISSGQTVTVSTFSLTGGNSAAP